MFTTRDAAAGAALLALLTGSCDIDTVAPEEGPADGQLGGACVSATDCEDELVCPAGGHLAGHCAIACDSDDECTVGAGNEYYCLRGVCTKVCGDTCGLGAYVGRCGTGERCVAQSAFQAGVSDCLSWCVP